MKHFLPLFVVGVSLVAASAYADTLDQAVGSQTRIDTSANQSQKRVDGIAERTDKLLSEYRLVTRRTDSLRVYNAHLEKIIKSQNEEVVSIGEQIETLETTNREIVPLMIEMLDALQTFVDHDLPFLTEERGARLQGLRDIMHRADVTTSEKYRRVMEAYQQENEYGRTIESYKGPLEFDGASRQVDFLRIGRVALMYQTRDREETGVWDNQARQWVELDDSYRAPVRQGLRVARKQAAPDILRMPVMLPAEDPQ